MGRFALRTFGLVGLLVLGCVGELRAQRSFPRVPGEAARERQREAEAAERNRPPETLPIDALANLPWLSGEPVRSFAPGQLYLVELWATVSDESVRRIALLNELDRRFGPRGLRIVGVAVGEADRQRVVDFVARQQDPPFEYPVAFGGKEGAFYQQWVQRCRVTQVPHAFLLRDGRLLLSVPANQIHDAMLEGLLMGAIQEGALAGDIARRNQAEDEMATAAQAFDRADQRGDVAGMTAALADLERLGFRELVLERCRFILDVHRGATAEALARVDAAVARGGQMQLPYLFQFSMALTIRNRPMRVNEPVWRRLEQEVTAHLAEGGENLNLLEGLTRLRWDLGDKAGAATMARRLEEASRQQDHFPWAYRRFADEIEGGKMPTRPELTRRFNREYAD